MVLKSKGIKSRSKLHFLKQLMKLLGWITTQLMEGYTRKIML